MPTYKTPDVYVEEIPSFPPSVAEVGTAIPAFIGYTERAKKNADKDLLLNPTKIYSLADFEQYFGGPNAEDINITMTGVKDQPGVFTIDAYVLGKVAAAAPAPAPAPAAAAPASPLPAYFLYWAIKMYFDNGGSQCYVVSVGGYGDEIAEDKLEAGLKKVELEDEPTLLIIPEAVKLKYAAWGNIVQKMLDQCDKLRDRFCIFDVYQGFVGVDEDVEGQKLPVASRAKWGKHLKYGAAYYPFVKTSITDYIAAETAAAKAGANVKVKLDNKDTTLAELEGGKEAKTAAASAVRNAITDHFLTLPPSGAVAGVYAAVDGSRGVWKAPANVALSTVLAPVIKLDNEKQGPLNIDPDTGKSINAIRAFVGKGTLIWGARTLAGNDNEWRYISVRRFFNMVEESVKKSTYWAVFEPNDANLWVKVRGMIENYLIDKWREGALAGATPKDAFFVKCGLGTTMTAQDILQGFLNVEIGMAVVRPAEFIVLKFSHKMQTS